LIKNQELNSTYDLLMIANGMTRKNQQSENSAIRRWTTSSKSQEWRSTNNGVGYFVMYNTSLARSFTNVLWPWWRELVITGDRSEGARVTANSERRGAVCGHWPPGAKRPKDAQRTPKQWCGYRKNPGRFDQRHIYLRFSSAG